MNNYVWASLHLIECWIKNTRSIIWDQMQDSKNIKYNLQLYASILVPLRASILVPQCASSMGALCGWVSIKFEVFHRGFSSYRPQGSNLVFLWPRWKKIFKLKGIEGQYFFRPSLWYHFNLRCLQNFMRRLGFLKLYVRWEPARFCVTIKFFAGLRFKYAWQDLQRTYLIFGFVLPFWYRYALPFWYHNALPFWEH